MVKRRLTTTAFGGISRAQGCEKEASAHQKSVASFSGSIVSCRPADRPHPLPWSQGVGARIYRIEELDEMALRTLKSATLPMPASEMPCAEQDPPARCKPER